MRNARKRSGFTLLEMIFAIGIIAWLMLALEGALTIALRARETTVAAVAPIHTAMQAVDVMRLDLEAVLPPNQGTLNDGKLAGDFVGSSQNGAPILDFYCIGNDAGTVVAQPQGPGFGRGMAGLGGGGAAGGGGAGALGAGLGRNGGSALSVPTDQDIPWIEGSRHVEYTLRTDVNPPMLVRRVSRNLLTPTVTDPEEEILCRNVKAFNLQYYDGTTWQTEWDSTQLNNTLPMAVELTMDIMVEGRPGKPATPYRITRVFPLACAKPLDSAAGGTGGTGTGGGN